MKLKNIMKQYREIILQLVLLIVLWNIIVHTNKYFDIILKINTINIALSRLLFIVLVLLLLLILFTKLVYSVRNSFYYWFFWFLVIISYGMLYLTYVHVFLLDIENVKDIIIKLESFSITINYSLEYKQYFMLKYMISIYPYMADKWIAMDPRIFSIENFQRIILYLDLAKLENSPDLSTIQTQCKMFISNYVIYLFERSRFIKDLMIQFEWEQTLNYKVLYILKIAALIVILPPVILKTLTLPFIPGTIYFNPIKWHIIINAREFSKAIFDRAFLIVTERLGNYDFELGYPSHLLEGVEREDFLKLFAIILIKKYGPKWIVETAEKLDIE